MIYVRSGNSKNFVFYFKDNFGNFSTINLTNAATCSFRVLDSQGVVVYSNEEGQGYHIEKSKVTLEIPSSVNVLTNDDLFTQLYLECEVVNDEDYMSKSFEFKESYRVIDFLPITKNANDVRVLLGVDAISVPDENIDIYNSYFLLLNEVGDRLKTALTSGGINSIRANEAIALKSAIELCPSLKLLIPKSETDNVVSQTRFDDVGIADLKKDLEGRLSTILNEISGEGSFSAVLFQFGTVEDILTGGE